MNKKTNQNLLTAKNYDGRGNKQPENQSAIRLAAALVSLVAVNIWLSSGGRNG